MKNFSTAALILALVAGFGSAPMAFAQKATRCEFLANAPDQHVVVRGDTLWGISGKFLQNPWCWPQVWGLNRDQIRDPHWIYPGQIVYFDRANGRLRLGTPSGGVSGVTKLSPRIRVEAKGHEAIPTISLSAIGPFLVQPLVIEGDEMENAPRIVAGQEGHVHFGKNDKAYVKGNLQDAKSFQVFRPGNPLKDPITGEVIANEAVYLGMLKLERPGKVEDEAHSFTIIDAKQEMSIGDRLVPVATTPVINFVPHAPLANTDARIVSIYGGVSYAGQNQIVTVNQGSADRLDVGSVLQLYRSGQTIPDVTDSTAPIKLPDERYGTLLIFRVFNHISYGLIMEVQNAVQIGDIARSPE